MMSTYFCTGLPYLRMYLGLVICTTLLTLTDSAAVTLFKNDPQLEVVADDKPSDSEKLLFKAKFQESGIQLPNGSLKLERRLKPGVDDAEHKKEVSARVPLKFKPGVSVIPLPLTDLQLPDHVEGLRVEHDGHLNKDYKKEILLGRHHEFDSSDDQKLLSRLTIIFNKADTNHDGSLVLSELKDWILIKVKEHLVEASRESDRIFDHLDSDNDGYVTWKEFHLHFLLAKGYKRDEAEKFSDDYDALALDNLEREKVIRYKFRWAEADDEPQDNRLTRDELKNFRHPEQNPTLISRMAQDIIDNVDRDGDGIITEAEFIALPHGQIDQVASEDQDLVWQEERRKEFRNIIDLDGNGKVDESELKVYVDPHNANHAQLEADNLMQLADENHDGRLSMKEVLDNAELFFGSKVVNAGGNFHDEF